VGKSEGKRPLTGPGRKWVNNVKFYIRERERGWSGIDWIEVAQNRDQWSFLVHMVMNLRISYNFGKFLSSCTTGGI
jgi:hypothetical protein